MLTDAEEGVVGERHSGDVQCQQHHLYSRRRAPWQRGEEHEQQAERQQAGAGQEARPRQARQQQWRSRVPAPQGECRLQQQHTPVLIDDRYIVMEEICGEIDWIVVI